MPSATITPANTLLERTQITAHVVDIESIVRGEYSENAIREDFRPSEIDAAPTIDGRGIHA